MTQIVCPISVHCSSREQRGVAADLLTFAASSRLICELNQILQTSKNNKNKQMTCLTAYQKKCVEVLTHVFEVTVFSLIGV